MDPILLLGALILAILVSFGIGTNDETMSPAVSSGFLNLNMAVLIGGILAAIGAVILGGGVSKTVGKDLVTGGHTLTTIMVLAVLISMSIYLISASATQGLPLSTTQCVVGATVAIAIFAWDVPNGIFPILSPDSAIAGSVLTTIFLGWIFSPIVGFFTAVAAYYAISKLRTKAEGFLDVERQERYSSLLLTIFLMITALTRGGNDVANAIAPLLSLGTDLTPSIFLVIGGIGMAVGLFLVGRKVVKTLATDVVSLRPTDSLAASISVSLVMFVGTALGLPLSGTHILVSALISVGFFHGSKIEMDSVKAIGISWIVTLPIAGALGVSVFIILNLISGFLGIDVG